MGVDESASRGHGSAFGVIILAEGAACIMRYLTTISRPLVALLALTVVATSAQAGWHEFWHNMSVGYHRNNAWPQPFTEVDAMQTMSPFDVMKRNGWREHNTIGNELFRQGDGALLAAGHNRVHWISTQCPEMRRGIYVLRGRTEAETQARVASVRQTVASLNVIGTVPHVTVTDIAPGTVAGDRATKISREALEQQATPKLPTTSAAGNQGVGN